MAMPNNTLSTTVQYYPWKDKAISDPPVDGTSCQSMGGLGLNNNAMGLDYQVWTFSLDNTGVWVESASGNRTQLFSMQYMQRLQGCFDLNMNPFVVFQASNNWQYWWFDTQTGQMEFSSLPSTVDSVACVLDDTRSMETANADILLFYTNNNNLYHRRQRDRYENELLLKGSIGGKLIRAGMNGIERLQIKLQIPFV